MALPPPPDALAPWLRRAAPDGAEVVEVDPRGPAPSLAPGSAACIVLTASLDELADPVGVLRTARGWLAPDGVLLCATRNSASQALLVQLLRSDLQAGDGGVLPNRLLHPQSYASALKALLEAGLSPDLVEIDGGEPDERLLDAAKPLLEHLRIHPERAAKHLAARRYVFAARPIVGAEASADPVAPITFVACTNDEAQLHHNLLASPCLAPGHPHEVLLYKGMGSAAEGLNRGIREASHDLVVLVQQDVYLPSWWPAALHRQWAAAVEVGGVPAVGGPVGVRYRQGGRTHVGHCVDRDALFRTEHELPADVDGLDEVLMVVPRDTDLRFDPALGWHLYGTDLVLQAHAAGRRAVALDVPCHHNSLLSALDGSYHHAESVLAGKWPQELPVVTNSTTIDQDPRDVRTAALEEALRGAWTGTEELTATLADRERALSDAQIELADREARIASMEASPFWKLRSLVQRALGRG